MHTVGAELVSAQYQGRHKVCPYKQINTFRPPPKNREQVFITDENGQGEAVLISALYRNSVQELPTACCLRLLGENPQALRGQLLFRKEQGVISGNQPWIYFFLLSKKEVPPAGGGGFSLVFDEQHVDYGAETEQNMRFGKIYFIAMHTCIPCAPPD